MNSKRTRFVPLALCAILAFPILADGNWQSSPRTNLSVGGIALSRPIGLRSDFAEKRFVDLFHVRSHWRTPASTARYVGRHANACRKYFHNDYVKECVEYVRHGEIDVPPTPKLKNGAELDVALGFDRYGGSRFDPSKIVYKRRVHLGEVKFVGKGYKRAMQEDLASRVAKNPKQFENVFSKETIEQYVKWDKMKSGPLNNPILKSGQRCEFHHDVGRKEFQVLPVNEHRIDKKLPSKGHGSGSNFAGGGEQVWGEKPKSPNVIKATSLRWGGVAGSDILVSSALLWMSGNRNGAEYLANVGSAGAACFAAVGSESLLVGLMPLSAGTTPTYIGGVAICSGGVASWIATGVYFIVRQAVMYGWRQYQIQQAKRIELACKKAERDERIVWLRKGLERNTESLKALIGKTTKE